MGTENLTDAEKVMIEEFARRRKEQFWEDIFKLMDLDVEKSLEKVKSRLPVDKSE